MVDVDTRSTSRASPESTGCRHLGLSAVNWAGRRPLSGPAFDRSARSICRPPRPLVVAMFARNAPLLQTGASLRTPFLRAERSILKPKHISRRVELGRFTSVRRNSAGTPRQFSGSRFMKIPGLGDWYFLDPERALSRTRGPNRRIHTRIRW